MSMKDVLKTEAGVKLAVLALAAAFVAGMAFATALAEKPGVTRSRAPFSPARHARNGCSIALKR